MRKPKKPSSPLAPKLEDEKVFGADGEPEELKPDEPGPATETPAAAPEAPTQFAAEPEPEPAHAPEPEARKERRGRPRGSYSKKEKRGSGTREADSPENITKLLLSVHQMLAAFTDLPELLLSQEEADKLGEAVAEVEALYADTSYISPEIRAWANLGLTGIMVYWPRYKVIKMRLEKEAREGDIDVTPIRPNGPEAANMSRAGTGTVQH